jgi:hypothetical protein
MERDTYEKLTLSDPELDSDQETITPRVLRQGKAQRIFPTLWLLAHIVFIAVSVVAWSASLWLTHLTSSELGRARSLALEPSSSNVLGFIPGGSLSVPGYGLIYNTSYCYGWQGRRGKIPWLCSRFEPRRVGTRVMP